jgi:crotonobetainyl-CoA:carnitine CoA-transferase CaiB-like acyl-CoA transferase
LVTFPSPVGPITALPSPANPFDEGEALGPIPVVGENSQTILAELGYSTAEIEDLLASAVVGSPR